MADLTASAGLVRGLFDFAVTRGADRRMLATRAGIDERALEDADARIPFDVYVALVREASVLCGDPALALHYGESVDMSEVSIVGLIMNASETMAEAFGQLQRFGQLALEVEGVGERFGVAVRDDGLWIVDQRLNPNEFPQLSEITFSRLACGPRRFLPQSHILEVHFTHPAPPYRQEYERVFDCRVVFDSDWNAMRMHPEAASWRVALQPRYVFGVLTERADMLMQGLNDSRTTRAQVEGVILPILHKGDATADSVASIMGFSRQTLFRRLREEGVTFEEVLDELRHRMALHYLQGKRASVNEVAYLVGFSDRASFSRAFKRWTGRSPGEVRAQIRAT
ncbi:MAG: AraC family transcriptional regulator [Proteobacteria bacterium HN_bin10]|nr:MAG: AraC family transcriptional regulator [Proteobacteria bacterium HN_bin10]